MEDKIEYYKSETIRNRERMRRLKESMEEEKQEIQEHKDKILGQIMKNEQKKNLT